MQTVPLFLDLKVARKLHDGLLCFNPLFQDLSVSDITTNENCITVYKDFVSKISFQLAHTALSTMKTGWKVSCDFVLLKNAVVTFICLRSLQSRWEARNSSRRQTMKWSTMRSNFRYHLSLLLEVHRKRILPQNFWIVLLFRTTCLGKYDCWVWVTRNFSFSTAGCLFNFLSFTSQILLNSSLELFPLSDCLML